MASPASASGRGSTAPPPALTLYTHTLCPYAHRVSLALAEKQLPHGVVEVDLSNKRAQGFSGLVPQVEYRGERMTESADLVLWLDGEFEGARTLGGSDEGAMRLAQALVSPGLAMVGGGWSLRGSAPDGQEARMVRAAAGDLEALLAGSGGPFLCGTEEPGCADVVLWPFAERFDLAMREFCGGFELFDQSVHPLLSRWFGAMAARGSVRATAVCDQGALLASWRRTRRLDYFDYETADARRP